MFWKDLQFYLLNHLHFFLIRSGIQLINQSYQVYLIALIFFISFCSNSSISSIDTIIGLKISSSISFYIFTSLYIFISLSFNSLFFNSIKHFSYSKRLFFTFNKNWLFRILRTFFLSTFLVLYFRFSILIYSHKKIKLNNQVVLKQFIKYPYNSYKLPM